MKRKEGGGRNPAPTLHAHNTQDAQFGPDQWFNHHMTLRSGSSNVVTRMTLPQGLDTVTGCFRSGRAPTSER